MLRLIRLITSALLLLVMLLLGMELHVRNAHQVVVNYFGGSTELPVSMLIATTLLGGAILGIVVTLITSRLNRPRRYPALKLDPVPATAKATPRAKSRKDGT
jgi:uncharacterized integral membrane protein